MQEVTLTGSRMFVWPGVHAETGENVRVLSRETKRAFVVTDRDCVEIARRVAMSLQQARFKVAGGLVPSGKGKGKPATIQQIAAKLGIAVGTAERTLQAVPKAHCGEVEQLGRLASSGALPDRAAIGGSA